jgi:cysteine desulfurase
MSTYARVTHRIDLDHNATTALAPAVRAAMVEAMAIAGNPSSQHAAGREARDVVERARKTIAGWLGGSPFGLVFTSGGTESDGLAVRGGARAAVAKGARPRVVVSAIEHPAVLGAADALGYEVVRLPVDGEGRLVDLSPIDEGAALVSVALANHELGVIADVAEVARRARAAGALVHCDAVQAAGKIPVRVDELGVDLLTVSAHKLNGPKGIGALWVRAGVDLEAGYGGHQERGRRAGTENVVGIAGFAAAVGLPRDPVRVRRLRDRLEGGLHGARVHGAGAPRVGNTCNAAWDGVSGELLAMALDLEGVCVSTGAACTSGTVKASPVLAAIGSRDGVRMSLGEDNLDADIDVVLEILARIVPRVRAASSV